MGDFTEGQVAALIEDLRGQFQVVSENVVGLRKDMSEVKERLSRVENRVQSLEDVVRLAIPGHERRISALEAKSR